VAGRDVCQVLVDNYVLSPKTYENKSVKEIVQDVWDRSKSISSIRTVDKTDVSKISTKKLSSPISLPNLNFVYSSVAEGALLKTAKIDSYKVDYGQTLHECFSGLLNQIGLYTYNVPGTSDILIHRIFDTQNQLVSWNTDGTIADDNPYPINNARSVSTDTAIYSEKKPNNVLSCTRKRNAIEAYRFFRIVGQTESELQVYGSFSTEKVKSNLVIEYLSGTQSQGDGINKFKVVDVSTVDTSTWKSGQAGLLNNELLQQLKEKETFKYVLAGHSPAGAAPYHINHTATVNDVTYSVKEQLKIVTVCTFKGSKVQGTTTELELCNRTPDEGWIGTNVKIIKGIAAKSDHVRVESL